MIDSWWAYLALGACVGVFAGMLGIGGGFVIVPVLALVFAAQGFAEDHVLHLALGTGMATILFTSASSVLSHHGRGAVDWSIVRSMAPGVMLGTFTGALVAGYLDVKKLSVLFTILVYYAATGMLLERRPHPTSVLPGAGRMGMAGGVIGLLSSFAAIGGAALTVPFLVKRNVAMHQAIATAAAVGWPLALAGAVGYAVSGFSTPGLPAPSIGYVYLPALFWVAISSMLMAPLGAALAHRMPARALRKVFAILLYALATRMAMSFLGP